MTDCEDLINLHGDIVVSALPDAQRAVVTAWIHDFGPLLNWTEQDAYTVDLDTLTKALIWANYLPNPPPSH
jgi:hypothetical protein